MFDRIEKPTLLVDRSKTEENIRRMAEKAREMGLRFRPHFKTHQSKVIGEWFSKYGVDCITVSSVEMAEYFAGAGWTDILIAFPINLRQIEPIEKLARKVRLGLLVESEISAKFVAEKLKSKADIWIEIDTGAHRSGVSWDDYEMLYKIAAPILAAPRLHLTGLLTHAGHTYNAGGREEICQVFKRSVTTINQSRAAIGNRLGTHLDVSVGDTPGCALCNIFSPVDEIRPGNFVFFDAEQFSWGVCLAEKIAVSLACPVVAVHPERNEIIIYGGAIHLSKDFFEEKGIRKYGLVSLQEGSGWSVPLAETYVASLSQEHGVIRTTPGLCKVVKPGDLIFILPAHSCLTVQAMRKYLTLDGEEFEILT